MSLGDASYDDLQQTTIGDLYETYCRAENNGNGIEAAREIEAYLQEGFETARETLLDYGIELDETPEIRYDPGHQGATYSPQRDHTLLNALIEEAVHTYHNQIAGEYFKDLELGEPIGTVYNDNCVLKTGYDEALTAPIVHDVADTDEPLEDHMERLSRHYTKADQKVGQDFTAAADHLMEGLGEDPDAASIQDALAFRDEMLLAGESPF